MRLVSPAKLLSIVGIGSSGGSLTAAEDALDATFPLIEEATESRLVASSTTDYFNAPDKMYDSVLRLSNGFLSSPRVSAIYSSEVLIDSRYMVDTVKGTVHLIGGYFGYGVRKFAIKYSHGYVPGEDPMVLANVPEPLQMAHLFMAASAMQLAPASMSKDKAKAMGIDASRGFEHKARQILQGMARPRAMVLWPAYTKV